MTPSYCFCKYDVFCLDTIWWDTRTKLDWSELQVDLDQCAGDASSYGCLDLEN